MRVVRASKREAKTNARQISCKFVFLSILAICVLVKITSAQDQQTSSNIVKQAQASPANNPINNNNAIKFEAPAQGQLSQHRQIAQVGQLLLNGVQQLAGAASAPMQAMGVASGTSQNHNHNHESQQHQLSSGTSFIANAISNVQSTLNNVNLGSLTGASSSSGFNHHNNNSATSSLVGMSLNEQGEILRQEIYNRANQLQQVVSSSLGSLRDNKDLIVKRVLEQMSVRLDHARAKADRIISEPANNELAVKALATINNGLTNINNIVTNLVRRLDSSNPLQQQQQAINNANVTQTNQIDHGEFSNAANSNANSATISQRVGGAFADATAAKFPFNLQQIRQQFSSAISAVQKQIAPQTQGQLQTQQTQPQQPQILKTSPNL